MAAASTALHDEDESMYTEKENTHVVHSRGGDNDDDDDDCVLGGHSGRDSLPVYASNEAEDGSDGIRWSSTDGPRRTMRKVSRRVLPLAAAAFGISGVRFCSCTDVPAT